MPPTMHLRWARCSPHRPRVRRHVHLVRLGRRRARVVDRMVRDGRHIARAPARQPRQQRRRPNIDPLSELPIIHILTQLAHDWVPET